MARNNIAYSQIIPVMPIKSCSNVAKLLDSNNYLMNHAVSI